MCGDFDDEFDEEFNDACESGLMLSIGEDGQLEMYVPEPTLKFKMSMDKAIEFIRLLHHDEKYKEFIDETEIGMDNVDEEEFIERILALNEEGGGE